MHEGEAAAPRPPYRRTCLHNPAFPPSMNEKLQALYPPSHPQGQVCLRFWLPPSLRPPARRIWPPGETPSPSQTRSPHLHRHAKESVIFPSLEGPRSGWGVHRVGRFGWGAVPLYSAVFGIIRVREVTRPHLSRIWSRRSLSGVPGRRGRLPQHQQVCRVPHVAAGERVVAAARNDSIFTAESSHVGARHCAPPPS